MTQTELIKAHQQIEIIITTVCDYYGVNWKEIKASKGKSFERHYLSDKVIDARHVISSLLYMNFSDDMASELLGYEINTIRKSAGLVFTKYKEQYKEIKELIYKKMVA